MEQLIKLRTRNPKVSGSKLKPHRVLLYDYCFTVYMDRVAYGIKNEKEIHVQNVSAYLCLYVSMCIFVLMFKLFQLNKRESSRENSVQLIWVSSVIY